MFLRFVQEHDSTVIVVRDSDSPDVEPLADLNVGADKTLCFWNRKILPHLQRKWVPNPGYYRIDSLHLPVLEFTSSYSAVWEGKPALGQGRLFGNFEPHLKKPDSFTRWYKTLARWIQQNYTKSRATSGGYVGSVALTFYENGGYFLPNVIPPETKEWLREIGKQHAGS